MCLAGQDGGRAGGQQGQQVPWGLRAAGRGDDAAPAQQPRGLQRGRGGGLEHRADERQRHPQCKI